MLHHSPGTAYLYSYIYILEYLCIAQAHHVSIHFYFYPLCRIIRLQKNRSQSVQAHYDPFAVAVHPRPTGQGTWFEQPEEAEEDVDESDEKDEDEADKEGDDDSKEHKSEEEKEESAEKSQDGEESAEHKSEEAAENQDDREEENEERSRPFNFEFIAQGSPDVVFMYAQECSGTAYQANRVAEARAKVFLALQTTAKTLESSELDMVLRGGFHKWGTPKWMVYN